MSCKRSTALAYLLTLAGLGSCDTGSTTVATPAVVPPCSGTIGDRVWKDANGNGLQDPGEPGLVDVDVTLTGASGTTTIKTDASGNYVFTGLCAGAYVVTVATPTDLVPTRANVGNDDAIDSELSPATVVLADDDSVDPTIDFGFSGSGSIGDRVWVDQDCDGLQDPGEANLENIRVTLRDSRGIDLDEWTDASGFYLFAGLCAGAYTVAVDESTLVPPLTPAPCNVGSDPALDSECSPVAVTLATNGDRNTTIDFGYCPPVPPGAIGDLVWRDLDGDGLQDPNEPGLPGVEIFLEDTASNPLGATVTDSAGNYLFDFLTAGDYVIEVRTPLCFLAAPCDVGNDDLIDNDCSPVLVSLSAGERNLAVDFGYVEYGTGQIGDFVWHDLDADGLQDPGETGIEMAQVTLRNEWGTVVDVKWTGPDGGYVFESLCAGLYEVQVDVSAAGAGFVPSPCNVGNDDTLDNDCSPAQVVLPFDDTADRTVDFGYHVPQPLAGCSHGYWKNHTSAWTAPYSPSTPFSDVFEDAFPGMSLLEVLQQGGGGLNALGREAAAGLLNAASSGVRYPLPDREVIERFDSAYPGTKSEYNQLKDELEVYNQLGCPLN